MKFSPRELVAAILAAGISLAIVTICVGVAVHTPPISAEESTLIATVLGAAVGALATYLGTSRHDDDDDEPEHGASTYRAEYDRAEVPAEVVDNPPEPTPRLPPPAGRFGGPEAGA